MITLTAREELEGPAVSLIHADLDDARPHVVSEMRLQEWSWQSAAPRLSRASDGGLLIAQVQSGALRMAGSSGPGFEPSWIAVSHLPEGTAVEDTAVGRDRDRAFLLLSGVNELVVVDRHGDTTVELHPLRGVVGLGSYWAMARMLALDEEEGVLLIGMNESVEARKLPEAGGGRTTTLLWNHDGWRWPVAMQQER